MNLLDKVSTLMSTDLITVSVDTPLGEAGKLFGEHGIHHLPVVGAGGQLEGIVSKSDFLKLFELRVVNPTVGSIMTSGMAKLEPTDSLRTAVNLFALNRFHALPVVEGERLVGILTTLDIIRLMDRQETRLEDYR
jgi:CBS domain-containing protein